MDDQEMELYDLQADPNETKNIYSSASSPIKLEKELKRWMSKHKPRMLDANSNLHVVHSKTRQMLESMGYLGE